VGTPQGGGGGVMSEHGDMIDAASRAILEAVKAFHIVTTPDALRKTERDLRSQGITQSADQILWSAKMALLDKLDAIERDTAR
jgi:hypothetical protein